MDIIQTIILGVVEGITEFLPVSSTAHLIIVAKWLGIAQTDFQKFFEVFIQSGAILAVIFLYFQYVWKHKDLIWKVLTSFVPTAIVGLLLHKVIKGVFFESYTLITGALLVVGLLFIIVEQLIKDGKIKLTHGLNDINWQSAGLIGVAQSLAVIPGVSRAGIVIVFMMILGYKREESAVYSFLLAVPTILAASALDFVKTEQVLLSPGNGQLLLVIVGFITSFVVAYFSVKWLVDYLKKNSLSSFGIYRIALAIILLLTLGL